MDFSSPSRALLSLERRSPALPDDILAISKPMLTCWNKLSTNGGDENENLIREYLNGVHALLLKSDSRWEALAVGLYCGTGLLELQTPEKESAGTPNTDKTVYTEGPRVPTAHPNPTMTTIPDTKTATPTTKIHLTNAETMRLATALHVTSLKHLEHKEPRIRTLVAKAVGAHAALLVSLELLDDNYEALKGQCTALHERIVCSIDQHMQQGRDVPELEQRNEHNDDETPTPKSVVLDDTTGWRALETNWQCLACLIQPLGRAYFELFPVTNSKLLEQCQLSATEHVNRHVRAAAMLVLEHWLRCAANSPEDDPVHEALCKTTTQVLKEGLADNWSQVRMAASVLCRVFFMNYLPQHPPKNPEPIYATLIPRCCLNRFYLAQVS